MSIWLFRAVFRSKEKLKGRQRGQNRSTCGNAFGYVCIGLMVILLIYTIYLYSHLR